MKYCRFLKDDKTHYGAVEERNGELWITGPAEAPEEDLAFKLALKTMGDGALNFEPMPLGKAELLAPVTPRWRSAAAGLPSASNSTASIPSRLVPPE